MPYEVWISIFHLLPLSDIIACSIISKDFKRMAEDGYLWETLFSKNYPNSFLSAQNISDWKFVFQMELSGIMDFYRCFHTKSDFNEDVLGIPLEVSMNPVTEKIQYIYSSMDIISSEAFFKDKVRKTVWKEDFTHFLPLYITKDHFGKAIKILEKTLVQLSPHWKTTKFHPAMAMEVIPKLMNTMVVLVCDKGVPVSDKVITGYCALHRLLIACIHHYPILQKAIDEKVNNFLSSETERHKKQCENLGDFWPLLSLSSIHWKKLVPLILRETFDRNVLWVCKEHAQLADVGNTVPNNERLQKTFAAARVSLKLAMFHVYFLKSFRSKPSLVHIAQDYDQYYGLPSHKQRVDFQENIKKILQVNQWPQFYSSCGLPFPGVNELADLLKDCVKSSLKKKYHNLNTDFSKIHQSGVSKILLKGESYTCNTSLKEIHLEEVWTWPDTVQFLDASCLVYSFDNKWIATVDWCRREYLTAIRHSGDKLNYDKKQGTHTIDINLALLPSNVKSLYITISAYSSTLASILSPGIYFIDKETKQELCTYLFEGKQFGENTAIIMAKLSRDTPTGNWKVLAIGQIGMGRASQYDPIQKSIGSWHSK
uniref:F-box domain-containing protein n=1 Tax=Arcella intermedia TaxID=1963864 RepID=A0A6B2KYC8_9EUKA